MGQNFKRRWAIDRLAPTSNSPTVISTAPVLALLSELGSVGRLTDVVGVEFEASLAGKALVELVHIGAVVVCIVGGGIGRWRLSLRETFDCHGACIALVRNACLVGIDLEVAVEPPA